MEIEVPAASPQTFSHITRHGRHILQLETVLIALYYPSALGSGRLRTGSTMAGINMVLPNHMVYKITSFQESQAR